MKRFNPASTHSSSPPLLASSIKSPKAARSKSNALPSRTTMTSCIRIDACARSAKLKSSSSTSPTQRRGKKMTVSSPLVQHHSSTTSSSSPPTTTNDDNINNTNNTKGRKSRRRVKSSCEQTDKKEQEWLQQMEQDRREGRALLRQMIIKSDDVDWKSVIAQADSLHQKQQKQLLKQQRRHRRHQHKERKSLDAVGSFSVNLLTLKQDEQDQKALLRWRSRAPRKSAVVRQEQQRQDEEEDSWTDGHSSDEHIYLVPLENAEQEL